jgi:hypothetical protein
VEIVVLVSPLRVQWPLLVPMSLSSTGLQHAISFAVDVVLSDRCFPYQEL